jgi:hypothetical protein
VSGAPGGKPSGEAPEASGASGLGPDGKPSEAEVPLTALADFLQAFKLNAEEAGYIARRDHNKAFLCRLVEENISTEIRTQLYAGGIAIPRNYQVLKEHLMTIASILECRRLYEQQVEEGDHVLDPEPEHWPCGKPKYRRKHTKSGKKFGTPSVGSECDGCRHIQDEGGSLQILQLW